MIEVFCDGASRGTGVNGAVGDAAIGVAIYKNQKMIGQYARGLGKRTNNEAEYEAVIHAILLCWAADLPDPIIYSDSLVVCNHINKEWECNESLLPLLLSVRELQQTFRFRVQHVPRASVWEADALANLFLDQLKLETGHGVT